MARPKNAERPSLVFGELEDEGVMTFIGMNKVKGLFHVSEIELVGDTVKRVVHHKGHKTRAMAQEDFKLMTVRHMMKKDPIKKGEVK